MQTINELCALLNIKHESSIPYAGISIDTRSLKQGQVFWTLPGEKVDGHAFVEEAFNKGAVSVVVDESYLISDSRLIIVKDRLKSLQELAKIVFLLNRPNIVIAITGTVGKTTTKEFVSTLLETTFKVFKTPGNNNSQIGLPLSILNSCLSCDVAVLEMGMTKKGDIKRLVELFPPDIALVNAISLVHSENFGMLSQIADAKYEIFSQPTTKMAILSHSTDHCFPFQLLNPCGKKTFGLDNLNADYSLSLNSTNDQIIFTTPNYSMEITDFPRWGRHNLHNILGALSIACEAKVSQEKIRAQISKLSLPKMRLEKLEINGLIIINDSYNSSPDGVIAAMQFINEISGESKRIGVFGSMLELGQFSFDAHRNVGEVGLELLDYLICIGIESFPMVEVWKAHDRPVQYFSTHREIAEHLMQISRKGDLVLLKGARKMEMEKVCEELCCFG